jgi:3-deoxy-D-manno-octulosonic-acid transferase
VFTANLVIGAQTAADAARFRALGAAPSRVHVTGNVKFDIDIDPATRATSQRLRALLAGADRPVWIAGSTHPGEEESVLDAHAAVTARHPDALLILVPRHPQRFDAVAALLARRGVAHVRRSTVAGASPGNAAGAAAHAAVLLVDTTGELLMFYGCADAAFVGGSLVPIGGHNLLEPAALGVPVLTGPSDFNAREVAALLLGEGAAHRVADAQELGATLLTWLADPALRREMGARGRRVVDENRGSVARLLALIEPMEAR